jgi:ABC-type antimicrobial peptide transport system permease subunit
MAVWVIGKTMQGLLFGVPEFHIATVIATALVMAAVSMVACLIPARRASRVDPMMALRAD